jgi:hypothetical protein
MSEAIKPHRDQKHGEGASSALTFGNDSFPGASCSARPLAVFSYNDGPF